ncbi:MAG: glutathione S-transferase [Burkholderiales bacterium]|nr:glutathione S-transferase [Burkholderiales bacterium]
MRLIGMLDSPYVRRVAVTLRLLRLPFEHDPLSVFSTFDRFRLVNPVVKAPTLVCDDGTVLMDSNLIIDYAETLAGRSLWPSELAPRTRALRAAGLAIAACEKAQQIVYEQHLRPPEKRHAPLMERVESQLRSALAALDAELAREAPAEDETALTHGGLAAAIAWRFMQVKREVPVVDADCPALAAHSARVEAFPAFAGTPVIDTANVSTPGYRAP